jgi:hypothetical protein
VFGIEEIARLAALQRQIDLDSLDDQVAPLDVEQFKKGVDRLDVSGFVRLNVARKVLEGKPFSITSDHPETISRCRSLADHMGASLDQMLHQWKRERKKPAELVD